MEIKKIAKISIAGALILILSFVPYTGYLTFGVISITIIPIIIALFAWYVGLSGGIIAGIFFGLGSYFKALMGLGSPVSIALFTNHPDLPIIPRIFLGISIGYIVKWLKELKFWKFVLTAFLSFFINTVFFIGWYQIIHIYANDTATFDTLMIAIYINIIVELSVGTFLGVIFYKLLIVLKKQEIHNNW